MNPRIAQQQNAPVATNKTGSIQAQPRQAPDSSQAPTGPRSQVNNKPPSNNGGENNGSGQGNGQGGKNKGNNKGDKNKKDDWRLKDASKVGKKFKGSFGFGALYKGLNKAQKKALEGDSTFQTQMGQFLASKNDYLTQAQEKNKLMQADFDRDVKVNKEQRTDAVGSLQDAFSSSGMLHSSGYGTEYGNTIDEYGQNKANLISGLKFGQQEITSDKTNFLRQLQIAQLQARSDAIRKAAAEKWGLLGTAITG